MTTVQTHVRLGSSLNTNYLWGAKAQVVRIDDVSLFLYDAETIDRLMRVLSVARRSFRDVAGDSIYDE